MVIRFDAQSRQRVLPLFDRLNHPRRPLPRRLTPREVAHRQRMLDHLRATARASLTFSEHLNRTL